MNKFKFRAWYPEEKRMIGSGDVESQSIPVTPTKDGFELYSHFTLMQCTGLLDKNGKEIYEGDILKESNGAYFEVIYCAPEFKTKGYWDGSKTDRPDNGLFAIGWEVAGNIYENPELVKE